jgi:hypothetical protein
MTGYLVPLTVLAKRIAPGSRFALVLRYVATWCAQGLVVVDAFACWLIGLVDRVKRVYFLPPGSPPFDCLVMARFG